MCNSAFHLGMHIECTYGTPILDILDNLPPLPLFLNYSDEDPDEEIYATFYPAIITRPYEWGIYHALRLRDRLLHIHLNLLPPILHSALELLDGHFTMLEQLSLSFTEKNQIPLTLPKAFLAPNLRHLALPDINLPGGLQFLTTTASLATLKLSNIKTPIYFFPKLLMACLQSLPQLEELSIEFSAPIPLPGTEREPFDDGGTPIMVASLKTFCFKGMSAYLECLVAQIRAPFLEQLRVTLFPQIAFSLPHLSHLINITDAFKLPKATVYFGFNEVSIITTAHKLECTHTGNCLLRVAVTGISLDKQLNWAARICNALVPTLSGVEHFMLGLHYCPIPIEQQYGPGEIDCTTWHTLLRSFIEMKELRIYRGLLEELSCALQVDEVGLDPEFLPNLQYISGSGNLFASFISTRRVIGRPVEFFGDHVLC
jgi:hypothetical protein